MSDAANAVNVLGNDAYRKKDFAEAIEQYKKAIEMNPTNIFFHNSLAAVYFETKQFEECVKVCEKANGIDNEHTDNFAKARSRTLAGLAEHSKGIVKALSWFHRSLSEFRDQELIKKIKEMTDQLEEAQRLAYVNPQLSQEERNTGDDYYEKEDFKSAMLHYNEAVKRDPENAVLYSVRAKCWTKLMEFQRGLEECNLCIKKTRNAVIEGYNVAVSICLETEEISKADEYLNISLKLNPTHLESLALYRKLINKKESIWNVLPPVSTLLIRRTTTFDEFIKGNPITRKMKIWGLQLALDHYYFWLSGICETNNFRLLYVGNLDGVEEIGMMVLFRTKRIALGVSRKAFDLGLSISCEHHEASLIQHFMCQFCDGITTSMTSFNEHLSICQLKPSSTIIQISKEIEMSGFETNF
uniref:TPR_REGION domain-containing protein n=1 Tax=Caenorhabditis tropicalis TaxID=1561998 RepID=A0A1I7V492_9PELO